MLNVPKINEDDDEVVTEFIDKYITCSLPNADQYPELNAVVKQGQTHYHTTTCQKQKDVTCRFNAPRPLSTKLLLHAKNVQQKQQLVN